MKTVNSLSAGEPGMRDLHVLCYGGGLNTVALLVECTRLGIIFDAILFADTGGEKKETYEYMERMNDWCRRHGQPGITIVKQVNIKGEYEGLYNYSIRTKTLPSIAYGYKSCSIKFKQYPQNKWCNNWPAARSAWDSGFKVIKYIGYDADESHRAAKSFDDDKYTYTYKLVEWGWGRFECTKRILDEELSLPPKSSCTYCPSMKPWEIIEQYESSRSTFYRNVRMEKNADLTSIKGLGRDYSWWDLIVAYRYLNLIKRRGLPKSIPESVKKLMNWIGRSKPVDISKETKSIVLSLFPSPIQIACSCYDGESTNEED